MGLHQSRINLAAAQPTPNPPLTSIARPGRFDVTSSVQSPKYFSTKKRKNIVVTPCHSTLCNANTRFVFGNSTLRPNSQRACDYTSPKHLSKGIFLATATRFCIIVRTPARWVKTAIPTTRPATTQSALTFPGFTRISPYGYPSRWKMRLVRTAATNH